MAFEASVHAKAIELTKLAIEMTSAAGSGHPTSSASLAHLVTVLMYAHMRYDPADPGSRAADRLVLSEGHAAPIVYAAAADLGMRIGKGDASRAMTRQDALRLRDIDSEVDGHPNPGEGFPFFPAATGSLGQGLSIAAGLALAARLDRSAARIFCLIGDGESREGQIWEAVDFLVDYQLKQVCPIFNCNGWGQTGHVSHQQSPEVLAAKLQAAGVTVWTIDGHAPAEIRTVLEQHAAWAADAEKPPAAIVARTIKGWGSPSLAERNYHGKALEGAERERALAELDETARKVGARLDEHDLAIPARRVERSPVDAQRRTPPQFTEALQQFGEPGLLAKGKLATRRAYGFALRALGHARPDVVVLDADVGNSTFSETFYKVEELKPRFFECRIAEQNMISTAAGLAAGGKVPFASTFGKFLVRAYDQIEMAIVSRLNLKIVGSHTGVSLAADGPSQMALPDVAFFRAFTTVRNREGQPVLYLLQPADAYAAYALTLAMAEHVGACYMRTMRPDVPFLYDDATPFTLGGHRVLQEGSDLLLVSAGYMLHETAKAAAALAASGVRATLLDLYSVPFDKAAIVQLARANQGRVLTVEDNYGAGIGGAVAEALAEDGGTATVRQLHVQWIPKSGRTPEDVLAYLYLAADDIVQAGLAVCQAAAKPRDVHD